VKAAVIGAGFSGRAHVDALRRVPGVELIGVAASSDDPAPLLAAADVVHNCTPNDLHLRFGTQAVEAGAHLVAEKPLGRDLEEGRRLADAIAASGCRACVAFTYRYFPAIARMRELVLEGAVGEVTMVRGTYLQDWLLETPSPGWRRSAARSGPSCTLADLGTHLFDLVTHVTGLAFEAVAATLGSALADDDGLDDHGSVVARLEGGARVALVFSQVAAGSKNDLRLAVDGELGSVAWAQEHPEELRVARRGGGTAVEMRSPDWAPSGPPGLPPGHVEGWADAVRNLVFDFYAAAAGNERARPPAIADGVRAAELVDRALRAAAEGAWVDCG
jgi:predicted dehydrogenase